MLTVSERIAWLVTAHGSLREVSRATGIDVAYLSRLASGEKSNPSNKTLEKIGLKKQVIYVLR